MSEINFYLDENSLVDSIANIHESTDILLNVVEIVESISDLSCFGIFCHSDFYSIKIDGVEVGSLLFQENMEGGTRDLILRLQYAIGRSQSCDEESDIGFAKGAIRSAGCGVLITNQNTELEDWWKTPMMMRIFSSRHIIGVARDLFVSLKLPPQTLALLAPVLFKNIYFYCSPSDIQKIGVDYDLYLSAIFLHLSYLNDRVQRDFAAMPENKDRIGSAGAYGVTISPESPNTHQNKKAMKERDIKIGVETISCEWHTKFEYNIGRIHFYPWFHTKEEVKKIVGEKIIVGIFATHLTT